MRRPRPLPVSRPFSIHQMINVTGDDGISVDELVILFVSLLHQFEDAPRAAEATTAVPSSGADVLAALGATDAAINATWTADLHTVLQHVHRKLDLEQQLSHAGSRTPASERASERTQARGWVVREVVDLGITACRCLRSCTGVLDEYRQTHASGLDVLRQLAESTFDSLGIPCSSKLSFERFCAWASQPPNRLVFERLAARMETARAYATRARQRWLTTLHELIGLWVAQRFRGCCDPRAACSLGFGRASRVCQRPRDLSGETPCRPTNPVLAGPLLQSEFSEARKLTDYSTRRTSLFMAVRILCLLTRRALGPVRLSAPRRRRTPCGERAYGRPVPAGVHSVRRGGPPAVAGHHPRSAERPLKAQLAFARHQSCTRRCMIGQTHGGRRACSRGANRDQARASDRPGTCAAGCACAIAGKAAGRGTGDSAR